MSKTLGNVIDPLDTIQEYGTDALRFTLSLGTAGQVCLKPFLLLSSCIFIFDYLIYALLKEFPFHYQLFCRILICLQRD